VLDALLALLRGASAAVAPALGASTLTSVLLLAGAAAVAAAAVSLLHRGTAALAAGPAPSGAARPGRALDTAPAVTQSDPDAPGHARPRAPGLPLG